MNEKCLSGVNPPANRGHLTNNKKVTIRYLCNNNKDNYVTTIKLIKLTVTFINKITKKLRT